MIWNITVIVVDLLNYKEKIMKEMYLMIQYLKILTYSQHSLLVNKTIKTRMD